MGGAFVTGLLKTDLFKPEDITVTNPHEGKLKPFAEQGTSVTTDNKMAAALADIVVLAVKPKVVKGVIDEIRTAVIEGNSWYYFRLIGERHYYAVSAAQCEIAVILNKGDKVMILDAAQEGDIRVAGTIRLS